MKPAGISIWVEDRQRRVRVDRGRVRRVAEAVAAGERPGRGGQVNVCFVDNRAIRRLNRRFRGSDRATDVLAFDLGSGAAYLADIVISTDAAATNAKKFSTALLYESYLYLIHGMLHILGYRDSTARERSLMRRKEAYYLKKLKQVIWR